MTRTGSRTVQDSASPWKNTAAGTAFTVACRFRDVQCREMSHNKKYTDTGNVGKLGYDSSILSRHQLNKFLVTRMVLYHLHEACLTYMFAHLLYFAERY